MNFLSSFFRSSRSNPPKRTEDQSQSIDQSMMDQSMAPLAISRNVQSIPLNRKLILLKLSMMVYFRMSRISTNSKLFGLSKIQYNPFLRPSEAIGARLEESQASEDSATRKVIPFLLVLPDSWFYILWVSVSLAAIFYYTTIMPYFMTINMESTAIYILELFFDVFFLADIVLNFNIAYSKKKGELVTDRRKIAVHYLRTNFFIDFCTSFPYTWFLSNDGYNISVNKLFRGLRAPKLISTLNKMKILSISSMLNKLNLGDFWRYKIRVRANIFNIFYIVCLYLFILHFSACVFIIIGRWTNGDNWISRHKLDDLSSFELYITAIYFCVQILTTVGFGDIFPTNTLERMFSILWMFFGVAFYGFMIAFITLMFRSAETRKSLLEQKLNQVESFKKETKVNKTILGQIEENLEHSSHSIAFRWLEGEKSLLVDLPLEEKNSFLREVVPLLANSVFFSTKDPSFLVSMISILRPFSVKKKDFLWRKNEKANFIVIVTKGSFAVMEDNVFAHDIPDAKFTSFKRTANNKESAKFASSSYSSYSKRLLEEVKSLESTIPLKKRKVDLLDVLAEPYLSFEHLGEGAYFGEEEIFFMTDRCFHVRARENSEVMSLSRIDFERIVKNDFPHVYKQMMRLAGRKNASRTKNHDKLIRFLSTEVAALNPNAKVDLATIQKRLGTEQLRGNKQNSENQTLESIGASTHDDNFIESNCLESSSTPLVQLARNEVAERASSPGLTKMFGDWRSILSSEETQADDEVSVHEQHQRKGHGKHDDVLRIPRIMSRIRRIHAKRETSRVRNSARKHRRQPQYRFLLVQGPEHRPFCHPRKTKRVYFVNRHINFKSVFFFLSLTVQF